MTEWDAFPAVAAAPEAAAPTRITVTPGPAPQAGQGDADPWAAFPAAADVGWARALFEGVLGGASANFRDELYGVARASGLPEPVGGLRIPVGAARLAYEALAGRGAATDAYEEGRDRIRGVQKAAEKQYPGTTLAGEIAGAVALPVGGALSAATLPARIGRSAVVGASYGAAAGAGDGEDMASRATGAATGAAFGAAAGGAAPVVMRGIEAAGRGVAAAARPVTNTLRGWRDPEAEAARRVVGAIDRDMRTGSAPISMAEWQTAQRGGAPVAVADLGGETTRALARSAANTSPEGRASLDRLANDRFEGQADRASAFLRRLVGGNVDSTATREGLRAAASAANRPAYQRAFSDPRGAALWDEGFQQIASAPVVQDAIRASTRTAGNRAAIDGFPPQRNPFTFDPDGYMRPAVGPDGQRLVPNLQFWDMVKRNLDDRITALQRAGENSAARDAIQLRGALVGRLDDLVPTYPEARAGAARFFGAEDALSAGEEFVRRTMPARDAAAALARMSPQERELFRQGFAARLIDEINNTRDRVNVLNKIAASPEARNKIRIALGEQGWRRVEAFVTVEHVMDRLRGAVQGNSTTARQFAELTMAGFGGYGYGSGGSFNPLNADPSGATHALLAMGLVRGRHRIDQRVARRVAEMLASPDPAVLARGVQMVAGNRRLLQALQNLDLPAARGSVQATPYQGASLVGVAGGRAEDQ
ncbi:hypothetical protein GJ689_24865 [Rhodoplanes serenus]|uniref:Uncharacterized protein n=1 Tax=Rhodoplanes serenus TaxID=200615 RepID=A0A9X5AU91_9BRAD|nr:hypothetical protein [Rhodoplanes serenus]MTW19427.1 hypothetical protein [Rhodoplanes serenus]